MSINSKTLRTSDNLNFVLMCLMLYNGIFSSYGGETKTGTPRALESLKRGHTCAASGMMNFTVTDPCFSAPRVANQRRRGHSVVFYSFAMIETSLACE